MALANVACLLGKHIAQGDNILAIDWDLEAPGLHYYLMPQGRDNSFGRQPGVVELFTEFQNVIIDRTGHFTPDDPEIVDNILDQIDLSKFVVRTRAENVYLLPAGNLDETYQSRLADLRWEAMYKACPMLYNSFAIYLRKHYAAVFIDSRTGMTDISGICTSLLPDKLVVVFTPNRQSLTGVEKLVRQCTEYRSSSPDLRSLMIYPLPSRIDSLFDSLRSLWRLGDQSKGIEGYQRQFERIVGQTYGLSNCDLGTYFDTIQIEHKPEFSYGEPVVVLDSQSSDRLSLLPSYSSLLEWLCLSARPWENLQLAKDRKRLADLRVLIKESSYAQVGYRHVDILREIVALSTKVLGKNDLATILSLQQLIEASISDVGERTRAIQSLDVLLEDLPSLPKGLRWSSFECLIRSATTLRKDNDARASRLRLVATGILAGDEVFRSREGLLELLAIADRLRSNGGWTEAQLVWENVLEKTEGKGYDSEISLRALRGVSATLEAAEDLDGALILLRRILEIVRNTGRWHSVEAIEALKSIIVLLKVQGRTDEAEYYQRSLSEAMLAHLERTHLPLEAALSDLEKARRTEDRPESNDELFVALTQVADLRLERGELDLALEAYTECLQLSRALARTDDSNFERIRVLLSVLERMGDVRSQQEGYKDALGYYVEAYKLARSKQDRSLVDANEQFLSEVETEMQRKIEKTRLQTVADGRL